MEEGPEEGGSEEGEKKLPTDPSGKLQGPSDPPRPRVNSNTAKSLGSECSACLGGSVNNYFHPVFGSLSSETLI